MHANTHERIQYMREKLAALCTCHRMSCAEGQAVSSFHATSAQCKSGMGMQGEQSTLGDDVIGSSGGASKQISTATRAEALHSLVNSIVCHIPYTPSCSCDMCSFTCKKPSQMWTDHLGKLCNCSGRYCSQDSHWCLYFCVWVSASRYARLYVCKRR